MRVYDPSGPYTEAGFAPDLAAGLPPVRESWIAARGYAAIEAARSSPRTTAMSPPTGSRRIARRRAPCAPARTGQLVTQYEFARAGIITEEMIYVAHRENLAREAALAGAAERHADGESFGAEIPEFVTPEFVRAEDRARPGDHPRQHQPRRTGADGDRPQFPGQGQRQYRQFRRHPRASPRRSRRWCGRSAGAPTR